MTNPDVNVNNHSFDPTKPDFSNRDIASRHMGDYYRAGSITHLGNFDMSDYVDGGTTVLNAGDGFARVVPSRGYIELGKAFDAAEGIYGKEYVSFGGPLDYEKDEVHDYDRYSEEWAQLTKAKYSRILQGLYVTREAFEKAEQEEKHYPFIDSPRVELSSSSEHQTEPSRLGGFAVRKRT